MNTAFTRIDSRMQVQVLYTRFFALLLFLLWIGRLWKHLGLMQLQGPPFLDTKADRIYWMLNDSGILEALLHYYPLSLTIDCLLLLLPLLLLRYPLQRWYAVPYLLAASLYMAAYNCSATHHEHTWVGVIAVAFLLCFKDPLRFSVVFSAIRYYACFLMASAALWKIFRGSLFWDAQMESILKIQHSDILTLAPNSLMGQWVQFLIEQPALANGLWYFAVLLELIFIIGFFTRRFDQLLFWAFWLFIICDYFVMGLHFWELSILAFFFWRKMSRFLD